jgi:ABC-type nitrate/sulfonate/bicarbonate transport system substrate-binding protein
LRTSRPAITPSVLAPVLLLIGLIIGVAGGYYYASSSAVASTTTSTTTIISTVTQAPASTSATTASMTSVIAYGGGLTQTAERMVVDTGKAQNFYASNGLSVQWLQSSPASNYANYASLIAVGASVGIGPMSDALLAEANGVPITIVGAFSGVPATTTFFALSNSTVKTAQDIAGKTVGVVAASRTATLWLAGEYYAKQTGINFTMVLEGNATNAVNALTSGKTAVMLGGISPLMPAGNIVTIVDPNTFYATPFAGSAIWATNNIIKQNSTVVKEFVNATLASVGYMASNSTYADNLYINDFQGTPFYLLPASSSVASINFTPDGTGGGTTLLAAVTNSWGFYQLECTGTCDANLNVANAVNTSVLPG